MKKFLIIVESNYHDIKVPKQIKKEFFHVTEAFLQVQSDQIDGTNIVRKIGKNDSYIYSQELRYVLNGERIQKKR